MSFDKELDEGNRPACSVTPSNVTNFTNHSMILRSSCKSVKCSAGEHHMSEKRYRSNLHLSCSRVLFSRKNFSVSEITPASISHHSCVEACQNNNILNIAKIQHADIIGSRRSKSSLLETQNSQQIVAEQQSVESSPSSVETSAFNSSTNSTSGNVMARTTYKKSFLSQTLVSKSNYNDHLLAHQEGVSSFNGSGTRRASAIDQEMHLQQNSSVSQTRVFSNRQSFKDLGVERRLRYSDYDNSDEDEAASVSQDSAQQSVFWSLFAWRKYLYFSLSKPTHYDVELLDRIRMFGKLKTVCLLFLPLILVSLLGVFFRGNAIYERGLLKASPKSCSSLPSLWPMFPDFSLEDDQSGACSSCSRLESKQVPQSSVKVENLVVESKSYAKENEQNITFTHQGLTEDEIKNIVQDMIRKEFLLQEEQEKRNQEAKTFEAIQNELHVLVLKFNSLSNALKNMKTEIADKEKKIHLEKQEISDEQREQLSVISNKIQTLGSQFSVLEKMLTSSKNCCLEDADLDRKITAVLLSLLSASDDTSPIYKFLTTWLSSKFVSNRDLKEEVLSVQESSNAQSMEKLKALIEGNIEAIRKEFASSQISATTSLSIEHTRNIVKEHLQLYDEDKTGLADYALESGGGAIINTRCTETYSEGRASFILFGIPLWSVKSSPRNAIQPDMNPGQCWAFKGSQGYLVIELSSPIRPTAFTIEHIPKSLSPTGSIDSAPKEFTVLGLQSEKDKDGKVLGEYVYDKDGESLQKFPVQFDSGAIYPFVELQIQSNHGDLKYTCLYRFRVHGIRS